MASRARFPRSLSVAAAVGFTLAGCGRPPEPADPWPIVVCHYFVEDGVARDLSLPWGIRLLDRPLEGWPALQQREGVRRATTLTGRDEVDHPFGYWIRTAPDSLEIGYPGGGGLLLELAIEHHAFRGHARAVGDALEPPAALPAERAYPVRLTWARCPDEP